VKRNKMLSLGLMVGLLVILISLGGCLPGGEPGEEAGFDPTFIIFLVLFAGIFYFLLIRPQRKRQKEHQHLMEELKRGDKVVTTGGIYGRIESISDDSVVLKVESGATIRVSRGSVSGKQVK